MIWMWAAAIRLLTYSIERKQVPIQMLYKIEFTIQGSSDTRLQHEALAM